MSTMAHKHHGLNLCVTAVVDMSTAMVLQACGSNRMASISVISNAAACALPMYWPAVVFTVLQACLAFEEEAPLKFPHPLCWSSSKLLFA